MNELDIEVIKEKYSQYKSEHYEDEREMRKLLKIKKLVPNLATEDKWKKDYKKLNDNLSDGLYYYNELKKMLSEDELKDFVEEIKFKVMKQRYIKFELDGAEDDLSNEQTYKEVLNYDFQEFLKEDNLEPNLFAQLILEEKDLIKKVQIVCKYQKSAIEVFFDTTSILKAEMARLFVKHMKFQNIDENKIVTACLVYAFKEINDWNKNSITEKEENTNFFQSLGFDDDFCKLCSEYNRYHETEEYERENDADVLELIDKFVDLIIDKKDKAGFSVQESIEFLNSKILCEIQNQYKTKFIQFIGWLEEIEVSQEVGIMTYLASSINEMKRYDISGMIETIIKVRELIGGSIHEKKVMRLEKMEKIQDKFAIIQVMQKTIEKTKKTIENMSRILKGYKKLSEGTLAKEEYLDR